LFVKFALKTAYKPKVNNQAFVNTLSLIYDILRKHIIIKGRQLADRNVPAGREDLKAYQFFSNFCNLFQNWVIS